MKFILGLFIQELIEYVGKAVKDLIARRLKMKQNKKTVIQIKKDSPNAKVKAQRMRDFLKS